MELSDMRIVGLGVRGVKRWEKEGWGPRIHRKNSCMCVQAATTSPTSRLSNNTVNGARRGRLGIYSYECFPRYKLRNRLQTVYLLTSSTVHVLGVVVAVRVSGIHGDTSKLRNRIAREESEKAEGTKKYKGHGICVPGTFPNA